MVGTSTEVDEAFAENRPSATVLSVSAVGHRFCHHPLDIIGIQSHIAHLNTTRDLRRASGEEHHPA